MVQPIQVAFQQQIQALKTQHEEFVTNLKQQQTAAVAAAAAAVGQLTPVDAEVKSQAPMSAQPGKRIFDVITFLQYFCHIKVASVSRRDFFQKHKEKNV